MSGLLKTLYATCNRPIGCDEPAAVLTYLRHGTETMDIALLLALLDPQMHTSQDWV